MALDVANQCINFVNSQITGIAGLLEVFVRTLAWYPRPETE